MELTLKQANQLIEMAFAHAREKKLKPMTVAVLDAGGHLKALQREDDASFMRGDIAFGKAYGALAMGISSREIQAMSEKRPAFVNSLIAASGNKIISAAGGVLIKSTAGALLGAVGVTGDTADNDEACAIAGIRAVGLSEG